MRGFLSGLAIRFAQLAMIAGLAILGLGPTDLALTVLPWVLLPTVQWAAGAAVFISAAYLLRRWFQRRVSFRKAALTQNEADIPFDLRHLRYIHYLNNREGRLALCSAIEDKLTALVNG